mgnify:CR=1 FL=1
MTLACASGFPGLIRFEPGVIGDERGYFFESYSLRDFHRQMARIGRQNIIRTKRLYATDAPPPRSQDRVYGP